jgi:hypothetical protein
MPAQPCHANHLGLDPAIPSVGVVSMDWKDIAGMVGKAAPILGGILGGPVGAIATAAGGLIASCFGTDPTPQAVADAMKADPGLVLKLREIEAAQQSKLLDWQTAQIQADLANTQGARQAEVDKARAGYAGAWATPLVATIVTAGFFVMLYLVLTGGKEQIGEAGMILLGSLSAGFGAVVNYYLGSSSSSARKDAIIGKGVA